jgi:hypothetical protein
LRRIDVTLEQGPGDLMRVAVGHMLSPWPAYGTREIFEVNEAEFSALIDTLVEGAVAPVAPDPKPAVKPHSDPDPTARRK